MSFPKQLQSLLHAGKMRIPDAKRPSDDEIRRSASLLLDFEKTWRLEMPAGVPEFSLAAGLWAATSFYRAAQLLMFRELPVEEIEASLSSACPDCEPVQMHYSVDLVFRFLPDLWKFTSATAENDPLSLKIRSWCFQWPLSSVGAKHLTQFEPGAGEHCQEGEGRADVCLFNIDAFADNDCLMRIYVDRIVALSDSSRMHDSRVTAFLRQATGMYPELAGELTNFLTN